MAGPTQATLLDLDWLEICRRIVSAQQEVFGAEAGIAARTAYEGIGEGGDRALVIDRRCEDIVFAELEALHRAGHQFVAISEERGEVRFGDPESLVVIDPIDGSLNARRTLPSHALSLALATGNSMAQVEFGYVFDFGASEEFVARRGAGARLDGQPLEALGPGYGLELVGLEAAKPELILPLLEGLAGKAFRVRAVGAIAISLCYVAGGRFDGMIAARSCRSVDAAAGQLIAREAGARVDFHGFDLADAELDLAARYDLAAALDEEMLATLTELHPAAERT